MNVNVEIREILFFLFCFYWFLRLFQTASLVVTKTVDIRLIYFPWLGMVQSSYAFASPHIAIVPGCSVYTFPPIVERNTNMEKNETSHMSSPVKSWNRIFEASIKGAKNLDYTLPGHG